MGTPEQSVYMPTVCTFELMGKKYVWPEPVIKVGRRQRAALLKLNAKALRAEAEANAALCEQESNFINAAFLQEFGADFMEILQEFQADFANKKEYEAVWEAIGDGRIKDMELVAAFHAVLGFVAAPFVRANRKPEKLSSANGNGNMQPEPMPTLETTTS